MCSPLVVIAHGGNHDAGFICNMRGALEYATCYTGKVEEPDKKKILEMVNSFFERKLSRNLPVSERDYFNAINSALIYSTMVGAPQVMQFLLGLPFAKLSRNVVSINTLKRDDVSTSVIVDKRLEDMEAGACAFEHGVGKNAILADENIVWYCFSLTLFNLS